MKQFALSLLLLLGAAATPAAAAAPEVSGDASPAVVLNGHRYQVEMATTAMARARGLMQRTELAADHGMLFVFVREAPQVFWMKDTLIPLDILYFDKERRLVSMQLDVPPCEADPCPTYPSNAPAKYVLELPAGTAVRIGASRGDRMSIEGTVGPVEP